MKNNEGKGGPIVKAFINSERCKGCSLCVINCPRKAIVLSDNLNSGGYKYPEVDRTLCVGCGICYTVCPDGAFSILEKE